jgi:hypothetical protein
MSVARPRPTHGGVYLLVAGPDGTGKSTLVRRLTKLAGEFPTVRTMHWRPGVLPRLGHVVGLGAPDPARPHHRPPTSLPVSLVRLVYYWLDQVVGYWLLISPCIRKGGLVIMERGYWDMLVDPLRYRLRCPSWIVRLLGALVPRPRLTVILGGDPAVIAARKDELSAGEVARQLACWRRFALRRSLWLESGLTEQEVFDQVTQRLRTSTMNSEDVDV